MADQAERVILGAEDEVSPVVGKANAALDGFEKKAESSYGKVIRISDQTRTSVQRVIDTVQKQAEMFGKSGVEKLISQRDQLLQRYAKEPAAIDAITKSYERMIAAQNRIDSEAKFEGFGAKVKQFIENPLEGAKGAIGGLVSAMGPMGTAVAVGAAALGTIALAGFEAMKSLGALGVQVEDAKLRLGMTTKQVGEFSFAARVAGQDIGIFERMMRGLTEAVEDESAAGAKARGWLQAFGVDLEAVKTGQASTADVIQQVAEGMERLSHSPDPFAEKKAMMDLFKRAGIEAIPVMEKLNENLKTAHEMGFGSTDPEQKRLLEYQKNITIIESKWDGIVRHMKEAAVSGMLAVNRWIERSGAATGYDTHTKTVGDLIRELEPEEPKPIPKPPPPPPSRAKPSAEANEWARNLAAIQKKDAEDGLDAEHKLILERDRFLEQGRKLHESTVLLAQAQKAYNDLILDAHVKAEHEKTTKELQAQAKAAQVWKEFEDYEAKDSAKRTRKMELAMGPSKEDLKGWAEGYAVQERLDSIALAGQRDTLNRQASHAEKMVGVSGLTGTDAIQATYQIRVQLAEQLAAVEATRIAKEVDAGHRAEETARAINDVQKQMDEAHEEAMIKTRELQKQQLDALKHETEGLWNTLLTHPSQFPKQLGDTIHAAVLKPVVEGMAGMTAQVLQPIIHGSDGGGGLAGVFKGVFGGGKQDPVLVSTDQNTTATLQNSAVMAALTGILAATMGIAAPSLGSGASGAAGVLGISVPSISAPAAMSIPAAMGGFTAAPWAGGGGGFSPLSVLFGGGSGGAGWTAAPGGGYVPPGVSEAGAAGGGFETSAGIQLLNRAPGGGSPAAGLLGTILGGGGQQGRPGGGGGMLGSIFAAGRPGGSASAPGMGGFADILKGIKGEDWGGLTRTTIQSEDAGPGTASYNTHITGVHGVAGAALSGGGMMLAQQGLLGSSRGTWIGVGEGAAGGAMIGMQMGGPLGALIGGVVGFGIGIGEELAGVETPERKAVDLIKSIYGVSIPQNSGTIKQVIQIAQSEFGGDVNVAVRSPNVRKLVMLYSEATGQKMPLSATTPYAGSLVEQGGNLYQQASYQDAQAHVYASNLPTLGGIGAGTYPTPGGPNTGGGAGATYLSLSIGGNDAANFMTGQYVTPQFVTDQAMAAQYSSYGRTQQSANGQLPGLTVG